MANEYYRRGVSKVLWSAATPANPPTAANITASVDLSPQINAIDGFTSSTEFIDVENLSTRLTPKLSGPVNIEGGSITFNEVKNPAAATSYSFDPIWTAMAQDSAGWLLFLPYGNTVGNNVEVWQATVGSR